MYTLPQADKALLDELGYRVKLADVDKAILANATFLDQIVADPEIFGHDLTALDEGDDQKGSAATAKDASSAGSFCTVTYHEHCRIHLFRPFGLARL